MKQKIVVITCAAVLNQSQSTSMLRLFKDFENRNFKVYYFGNEANDEFEKFKIERLNFNRIWYKINFYKVLWSINSTRWISRLLHNSTRKDLVIDELHLRSVIKSAVRYLCTTNPNLFICWNPHSAAFGVMAEAARIMGIKVGAIEWGLLPDSFILDKDGTLATSRVFNRPILYKDPKRFLKRGEEIFTHLSQKSISFYKQTSQILPNALLETGPEQTRILVLGIDMVDSACVPEDDPDRLGLLPFHTSCLFQAESIAETDPNFRVILKPHPGHNFYPESKQISSQCWIINSDPDELIKWADVVVCSGSKMEFAAILCRKPLVNIGAGTLYKKGCTYEVSQISQLRDCILLAKEQQVTQDQMQSFKTFLGYLYFDYLYMYDMSHDNGAVVDRVAYQK
jgi:hypothetical protein